MGEVTPERFAQITAIGKLITDFSITGEGVDGEGEARTTTSASPIQKREEEEDSEVDEVLDASDVDEDDDGEDVEDRSPSSKV